MLPRVTDDRKSSSPKPPADGENDLGAEPRRHFHHLFPDCDFSALRKLADRIAGPQLVSALYRRAGTPDSRLVLGSYTTPYARPWHGGRGAERSTRAMKEKEPSGGVARECFGVGDQNGDREPDLAIANTSSRFGTSNLAVRRGNGDGSFGAPVGHPNFYPWPHQSAHIVPVCL